MNHLSLVLLLGACASLPTEEGRWESTADSPAECAAVGSVVVAADTTYGSFDIHGLNIFTGYAWERGGGGFKIGADYEYRFTKLFGLGLFLNYIYGDFNVWVIGLPTVFLHPWKELTLIVSPGVEIEEGGETEVLLRLGGYYEFSLGGNGSWRPPRWWTSRSPRPFPSSA